MTSGGAPLMGVIDDLSKRESPVRKAARSFVHHIPEDGALGEAQLLRDNRTKRVLYMSVGKDFANVLLTALSLPASILSGILAEATYLKPVGCIANIFESLRNEKQAEAGVPPSFEGEPEDIGPGAEQREGSASKSSDSPPEQKKKVGRKKKAPFKKLKAVSKLKQVNKQAEAKLLRAAEEEHGWHLHIYKQLIMHQNVEMTKISKKQYRCPNAPILQNCSIMVTELKGKRCMQCKEEMTVEVVPNNGLACITDAPFVVFSEKLRITPLRTVHSFVELMMSKKEVDSLTCVDMCVASVGIKEVLLLAHASLTSSHPLTQVFSPEFASTIPEI